ncbi:MAG: DUF1109 domain-containing protein [Pseudomonadota bacterium]|jgi:hypothetical protein
MKTQDLIGLLASDPLPTHKPVRQQLAQPLAWAAAVCGLLVVLVFGINPALSDMARHPAFITKMLWLASLMIFSALGLLRLARPGLNAGHTFWGLSLSMLAMTSLGLVQSLQATPGTRADLWLGASWQACSLSILGLSLPVLGALLWALRQLAPTRPALAGAAAGWMAASVAASLYSLHCTETTFTFFTAWYGGGMLLVSLLGAALGARCLRW